MKYKTSIDKITIIYKTRRDTDLIGDFQDLIERSITHYGYEIDKKYTSMKVQDFKFNITIKNEESVVYIGICKNGINGGSHENSRQIKIEYNPNKTEMLPTIIISYLRYEKVKILSVLKIDYAIDVPCEKNKVRYHTKSDIMIYGTTNNNTTYIRPKSNDGRIKIYDKTKERETKNQTIEQTTRIEITIRKIMWWDEDILYNADISSLQKYSEWISEISIPCDVPMQRQKLIEKYGKYNESTAYMIEQLNPEQQNIAISLMGVNDRKKWREYLSCGDYEKIYINEYDLMTDISDKINQIIMLIDADINMQKRSIRKYDNKRTLCFI